MRKLSICITFLCAVLFGSAAGIREGMSLAEVEEALGRPLSSMSKGNKTVLNYPDHGRVELVGGKVTSLFRVRHQDDPLTPLKAAAQETAKAGGKTQAQLAEEARSAKEQEKGEAEWVMIDAKSNLQIDAAIEEMTRNRGDQAAAGAAKDLGLTAEPEHFWIELAVALLVQIGLGMVLLKMAFAWTDVHADWGQMFLPALAAAASGALVRGAGFALWHTTQFFYLDDAVSYGALLFALLKSTHACTWQRAAGVGMAAKLMSMVVWVFLGVAIPKALFT
jgi:hypothetical protein